MTDGRLGRPVLLTDAHRTKGFDSGTLSLNEFLQRFALENHRNGKSRTYVSTRDERVVAYYSLVPGSVVPESVPDRVAWGQGTQDIPVILLARLAVDVAEQGQGLGAHMLLDALLRASEGARVIGERAVLVHAQDARHLKTSCRLAAGVLYSLVALPFSTTRRHPMAKVNVSMPDALLADVDELASELERTRSGLVREATVRYVAELHREQAARERERGIREAMAGMREVAERVPSGPDTTELIRADRDADYGHPEG